MFSLELKMAGGKFEINVSSYSSSNSGTSNFLCGTGVHTVLEQIQILILEISKDWIQKKNAIVKKPAVLRNAEQIAQHFFE